MRMWSLPRAIVSIVDTIRFQALSGVTPSPKLSLCALSGLRSEFSHCGLAREWWHCQDNRLATQAQKNSLPTKQPFEAKFGIPHASRSPASEDVFRNAIFVQMRIELCFSEPGAPKQAELGHPAGVHHRSGQSPRHPKTCSLRCQTRAHFCRLFQSILAFNQADSINLRVWLSLLMNHA